MFIRDVERDSPAWDAGLRPGSRIIRINDRKDPDLVDLYFFRDEPSEIEVGFDGRVTKYFLKVTTFTTTKQLTIRYNRDSNCPRFQLFLQRVVNQQAFLVGTLFAIQYLHQAG
ncbi:MAG TPA: hypothetical protein EYP24_04260, partial [bacterium (Candidatus Stahlbacteria)]|nr:hypothetical protein [Candidatus Stahlbacteria bacterium]